MTGKREPDVGSAMVPAKRPRVEGQIVESNTSNVLAKSGPVRTSSLKAPTMLLGGHEGEVFGTKFSPDGKSLASASFDKRIFLWRLTDDCENYMMLTGHKNAVLDVHWSTDSSTLFTCSADKTVRVWDLEAGKQVKKYTEHTSFVNSCCPARRTSPLIVSGSDDGTTKLWDSRKKGCVETFPNDYQVTAVAFSKDADRIYSGSLDNDIKIWDLRKNEVVETLKGHTDTVTGISLDPSGSYLLSNAMDNTLRVWDVKPFCAGDRCVKMFSGHTHNFEKNLLKCNWAKDGSKVSCGSADRMVYVWDTTTQKILYKLPGHNGSVNEVDFHPDEPIIASGSSDRRIYVGEIRKDL